MDCPPKYVSVILCIRTVTLSVVIQERLVYIYGTPFPPKYVSRVTRVEIDCKIDLQIDSVLNIDL